jgi:hypothetical protein
MDLSRKLRDDRQPDRLAQVVGQLYRSHGHQVAELVANLAADQRAMLALFCYGRAHMREIGLSIAATCDSPILIETGGPAVGQALFELSRKRSEPEAKPRFGRPKITLATVNGSLAVLQDGEPAGEKARK